MPTLLDAEQQGFTQEDAPDMAAALGGGGPAGVVPKDVPQSDSSVIAERLLGPELADRYGDVLGIRKGRAGDFWRDFGNEYAGRGNAEAIKQRVLDQYQQKYQQNQKEAAQKDQETRQNIQAFAELVRGVKDYPPKHRSAILKEGFEKLNLSTSPAALKLLADPEGFDTSKLFSPEMMALAEENSAEWWEQAQKIVSDPQALVAIKRGIDQSNATKENTGRLILRDEEKRAGIAQTRARTDLLKARTEKVRSGKGEGASKTPLLDKLRAGGAPATPRTSTTPASVTVRKKEPAGIAQAVE